MREVEKINFKTGKTEKSRSYTQNMTSWKTEQSLLDIELKDMNKVEKD